MAITGCIGCLSVMCIMGIGHYVQAMYDAVDFMSSSLLSFHTGDDSNGSIVMATCALSLAFAFFALPNVALVDSAVMKILGPNKILYGEQRLWGSVSAGLTILLVGVLMSITNNLDMMFWVCGGSTLCFMVFAFMTRIPSPGTFDLDDESVQHHDYMDTLANDERTRLLHQVASSTQYNYDGKEEQHDDAWIGTASQLKLTSSIVSRARTLREEANDALETNTANLGLAVSRVLSVEHASVLLPAATGEESDSVQVPDSSSFRSPRVLTFLSTTLLFGIVLSIIINYLFLFLNNHLHMPASWIGWTGPVGGSTELLCFYFSKQLSERFGVTKLVVFAHFVTIARCLAYTWLVPDSFVCFVIAIALQTMHGFGFAIFWSTAVSEVDSFFPPEQRAVAQGVLGSLHLGLGNGLGALLGGYLDSYLGAIWMFRCNAILCGFSILVFAIGRLSHS
ncbi:MFS general substrate transporter [Lichtheimia hyalospora FSU 10163]|nr:MFS general substrate transporter [Lichtheimia hyalospora FSU 10163]